MIKLIIESNDSNYEKIAKTNPEKFAEIVAEFAQDMDWGDYVDDGLETYDEMWANFVDKTYQALFNCPESIKDLIDDYGESDDPEALEIADLIDRYYINKNESVRRKKFDTVFTESKRIHENSNSDNEASPKKLFNKIISKLRKYAKEHDCYMTLEKFGMYDNSGNIYLYITTNRTTISGSVKFTFQLEYGKSQRTDWKTYFAVSCLDESDAPSFDSTVFYSYEEAYEFILDYIIKYGNIGN